MINKNHPAVEELILDDSFVEFIFGTNPENKLIWEDFISQHPESLRNVDLAKKIILSIEIKNHKELSELRVKGIVRNVQSSYRNNVNPSLPNRVGFVNIFRYAAILFVVLAVGFGIYFFPNTEVHKQASLQPTTYSTFTNVQKNSVLIKLSDKSSVILRPLASLKYPLKFTGDTRQVYLSGDAFFEVHKDKSKPFYVISNTIKVRVLGTSFMVSENAITGNSTVLVSTGLVEVSPVKNFLRPGEKQNTIVLTANEQVSVDPKKKVISKDKIMVPLPLSAEAAAKKLNFVSVPFSSVVKALEMGYNITIDYDEAIMRNCLLTASLVDQSLDERLELICKAVEADYHYQNGKIIITGRGCK